MFTLEFHYKRYQLKERAHAALMKEINIGFQERQRDERVPKHFTMQAYSEYNARPRSAKYNALKSSGKGEYSDIRPNVFSGTLQRSLKFKITATQKGSKLYITGRLRDRVSAKKWAKMSPLQQAAERRKQRRLAKWQKEEIARLSRAEIRLELKRQASAYKRGATGKYRRLRQKRIK